MFRASLLRLTRVPVSRCFSTVSRVALPQITKTTLSFVKPTGLQITRFYSHGPELTKDIIKERVIELLEGFDKIEDKSKITPEAHFSKDLNLDSLDVVEVVMALEEEFSISVNDEQSDSIKSVQQAIDFIAAQPDAV